MLLNELSVYHLSKGKKKESPVLQEALQRSFPIDTCQRQVWVLSEQRSYHYRKPGSEADHFQGEEAYEFLLRLCTGLLSEMPGETEVFGQVKSSWKEFCRKTKASSNHLAKELSPWIQRVFEDSKQIRTDFLSHMGGSSYGTLVRKVLKGDRCQPCSPTLVVGAGQLAQGIIPYLVISGFNESVWLWNRTASRAAALLKSLKDAPVLQVSDLDEALRKAHSLVICAPYDSSQREWARTFYSHYLPGKRVIHLGAQMQESEAWLPFSNSFPGSFLGLDHLFMAAKVAESQKSDRILRAQKACSEKTKLRALGSSLSIAHGWEDLACFASI